MTNEQKLRLEILELRLAMAALERVAKRQQRMIDTLRERAASESIRRGKDLSDIAEKFIEFLDEQTEVMDNARNQNARIESA